METFCLVKISFQNNYKIIFLTKNAGISKCVKGFTFAQLSMHMFSMLKHKNIKNNAKTVKMVKIRQKI